MKKSNQILAAILVLLLLCGLVGCALTDAQPTGHSGIVDSGNTGVVNGDYNWVWADSYEGTFSDQGYYYCHRAGFLYFLDTTSGVNTALCTKAGCLHAEESDNRAKENCEAYLAVGSGPVTPMCFWNGNLYYMGIDMGVYRSNTTGTERSVIGSIGTKYTAEQKTVDIREWALAENFWYFNGRVHSIVRDQETGVGTYQWELQYIGRINLATGEEEILFEDKENDLTLCAVNRDGVLFTAQKHVDIKDPSDTELLSGQTVSLKHWDGTNGQLTTLFQKESTSVAMIADGKAFCNTYGEGEKRYYTLDLATGQEETVLTKAVVIPIGGGYALAVNEENLLSGNIDWFLYDLRNGKKLSYEPSESMRVKCITDRGCILRWSADLENRMCYVTYESLADGLQKSDLMCYYTWKNG